MPLQLCYLFHFWSFLGYLIILCILAISFGSSLNLSIQSWDSSENQIVSRKQARVLVGLGHRWCLGNGYLSAFPKSSKSWDEIKHKYPRKHRLCSQKPIIPGSKRGAIRRQGKKEKVFCRGLAAPMLQGYSPWSLLPQLQVSQTFL